MHDHDPPTEPNSRHWLRLPRRHSPTAAIRSRGAQAFADHAEEMLDQTRAFVADLATHPSSDAEGPTSEIVELARLQRQMLLRAARDQTYLTQLRGDLERMAAFQTLVQEAMPTVVQDHPTTIIVEDRNQPEEEDD